ncbi:MAG: tRNA (adenosine(37)-N6)-dimethylallyltransferase MiaA [Clostridia bacterium]
MRNKIICIVGPTASGKTSLAIAVAKKNNGEIISADSMQIYKGLNIGTAKVTKKEMQEVPHHMIDICNIGDNFSVADFKVMCYHKADDIIKKGKNPVIVGGTGLYISAIVNNMQFDNQEVDFEYRNFLENFEKDGKSQLLYEMLQKIDPLSAKQIHPNNVKRIIRALEIAKFSDKLKSKHMELEKCRIQNEEKKYDFLIYYIDTKRDELYKRIDNRVDDMINMGLIDEAKMVYNMNLSPKVTCMQAIGYKEIFPFFKGEKSIEDCIDKLKQETRKYAKRQETWFKNKLNIKYISLKDGVEKAAYLITKNI